MSKSIKVKGFFQDVGGASLVTKLRAESIRNASPIPDPKDFIRDLADLLHPASMRFRVAAIRDVSPTSKTFRLESLDGHIPVFQCGQYLNLRLKIGQSLLTRPYSISSAPYEARGEHPFVEFTVRRNTSYLVPDYLFQNVKEGDELEGNKKAVRQELLEGRVVSCVIDALNDDGIVNWIADAVAEMQKREIEKSRVAPEALKAELAGVKKSIKGIMAAIEAGVFTASTKGRLLELEGEQERLEAAIADASLPVPTVDREAFVCWLTRFRGVSNLDEETRREAVNALVWQVRVWDDHAEAVLNYAGTEEIVHVPLLDGSGGGSPDGDKGWGRYPLHGKDNILKKDCKQDSCLQSFFISTAFPNAP